LYPVLAPAGPAAPVAPVGPTMPCGPVGPGVPPAEPCGPVAPWGPVAPCGPSEPCCPVPEQAPIRHANSKQKLVPKVSCKRFTIPPMQTWHTAKRGNRRVLVFLDRHMQYESVFSTRWLVSRPRRTIEAKEALGSAWCQLIEAVSASEAPCLGYGRGSPSERSGGILRRGCCSAHCSSAATPER
jgi:hypothetical protein